MISIKVNQETKHFKKRAVVVALLVEQSLPAPEVRGSNPVFGKSLYGPFAYCQLYCRDEYKEKEAANGPLKY